MRFKILFYSCYRNRVNGFTNLYDKKKINTVADLLNSQTTHTLS